MMPSGSPTLSIRWKVALVGLLAVTLGFAIAAWLASESVEQLELGRLAKDLETRAGLAILSLTPRLQHLAPDREPFVLDARLQRTAREIAQQAAARVTVISPGGLVLADSDSPDDRIAQLENHARRPEVAQALAVGHGTDIRTSRTTGERLFYLAMRAPREGSPLAVVRLALPLTMVETQIHNLQRALWIAFGIAFVVAIALSVLLARRMTRPLVDIVTVARQLAEGALGRRVQARSHDELGVLADTLNQMAEQLELRMTELRRLEQVRKDFVANVSHELRTPLTSIKGYVEALIDGAKDDPQESTRFLEVILKQSDRLNLILEDLLQLSQIESGQVLFKRDTIPLQAVVERTVPLIKPLAEKKGHRLRVSVPTHLPPVQGDEDRLVQVLTNLLDNAVKYTPPNGSIEVSGRTVQHDGTMMVELAVADTGIGIPEADRPRVFERFYRVDKARSRELGGTGLGLSIVKHIVVEGHGGRVWVEENQPRGSRFVIRLPAAGAQD
jgi:signal transduction histidine kinase